MMNYLQRQKKLLKLLESKHLDAILIKKRQNISYLVGTRGMDAVLFISAKKNALITDSRYKEEYARCIKNCHLKVVQSDNVHACISQLASETLSMHIGFESNIFSYSEYGGLKRGLKDKKLVPVKEVVESLRMIKDPDEVRCIREACSHGSRMMKYAINSVRISISELDVKKKIEDYITKKGLYKAGFDIIIASGRNAAMPHAAASEKIIKRGEMVIIDLGAVKDGYNSDLTRTVFLGRIDRKSSRIYNIVSCAQKKAIENIRPGGTAKSIDNISRQYISKEGLGKHFIHSLGHGIGMETHENPRIHKNSGIIFECNMTVTVEPGVYIPGWGGVRIEDVVLVTEDGCEVLTEDTKL